MTQPDPQLLPGMLALIVLQLLHGEPTNGYDLTLRIQATTNDVLNVNAGSLYRALHRRAQKGLRRAAWAKSATGRQTNVYSLTAAARKHLTEQRGTWESFAGALAAILRTA